MNKEHSGSLYSTSLTHDNKEGSATLELRREARGKTEIASRIVFWDAEGQFSIKIYTEELPLPIVEEFISEARRAIPVR